MQLLAGAWLGSGETSRERVYIYIYRENYYPVAGYKITYSIATLSYDNYYINLHDYSNSLLDGLL